MFNMNKVHLLLWTFMTFNFKLSNQAELMLSKALIHSNNQQLDS